MNRDEAALLDILEAGQLIQDFVGEESAGEFLNDPKTRSSVLYQLLVIGEAVKRLSPEFRAAHPSVPWTLIAGMRDHLIHAYDIVDWEEVWSTITEDVPALLAYIKPVLPEEPKP